jgi:AraC family transcriptional activator of tynA and feaB
MTMAGHPGEVLSLDQAATSGYRQDQWEELLSNSLAGISVRILDETPTRPFQAMVRRRRIDDLALVDVECDRCTGFRGAPHIARTDRDFVAVLIVRAGSELVTQGDSRATMGPGDVAVWDSQHPVKFTVRRPLSKRNLLVPRAALEEVSGRIWMAGGVVLDSNAPATKLLSGYLDLLSTSLDQLTPSAVSAARNATLDLLVGAVRPGRTDVEAMAANPALRAAMEAWIDRHLAIGDITPTAIAEAHAVSVRTVYRVFEATGETVGAAVRVRRLARARAELSSFYTPIAVIARRWGFSDPSHFARAFRAHYGCSPSDHRATILSQSSSSPS